MESQPHKRSTLFSNTSIKIWFQRLLQKSIFKRQKETRLFRIRAWKHCLWQRGRRHGPFFVYSLDYARTRISNDMNSAKKGGQKQFNGLIDVYKKFFATDFIACLYRGFSISCVWIIIYRGLYFGIYDSVKAFLPRAIKDSFIASFGLGFFVTNAAKFASYPIDTIRRRIMMT